MRPALFSECDDTALVTDRAERTLAALAFEPDGSRSFGRPFGRARIRNAFRLSAKIPGPEVFCLHLIAEGKIDTEPLITHTYPLRRIAEGYELFEKKRDGVIKVAVEC